jgi:hypothetical protein
MRQVPRVWAVRSSTRVEVAPAAFRMRIIVSVA